MKNNWYSAEDLPVVRDLRSSLALLKLLTSFPGLHEAKYIEAKNDQKKIEKQLDETVKLVDGFYDKLGPRHWIFTNYIDPNEARTIAAAPTEEEAEKRIIAYYQKEGTLDTAFIHLHSQPAMIPRLSLLHLALEDYKAGRYYSSVLVLITVMDGFVNDCNPQNRKDQSSLKSEDMRGWNGIAALEAGLPTAQRLFTKGFYKLDENEVIEVYRNGIVHGMLTNYNNVIVATKAWNLLFAVLDWKQAKDDRIRKDQEQGKKLTIRELLNKARHDREDQKKRAAWQAHSLNPEHPEEDHSGAYKVCIDFLTAWHDKNYGALGSFLYNATKMSAGRKAGEARQLYSVTDLKSWQILEAYRTAPAVATFKVFLNCDRFQETRTLRFVRFKARDRMDVVPEWERGCWMIVNEYGTIPDPPIRKS